MLKIKIRTMWLISLGMVSLLTLMFFVLKRLIELNSIGI